MASPFAFLTQYAIQAPLLLIWLVGMALALLWWQRAPKVALVTCVACGLFLLDALVRSGCKDRVHLLLAGWVAPEMEAWLASHDVDVLRQQNKKLQEEARRLQSSDEIERIAREQFNMVFPGEQVYKVMPAPEASTTTTVP